MLKLFVIIAVLAFASCSNAQQPKSKVIMHRTQDTTKSATGWYYAKSTDGNFSALLPVPFNDFTIPGEQEVYVVGGRSREGIKFAVTKVVNKGKKLPPFEDVVKDMSNSPDIIVNIKKGKYINYNSIYFEESNKTEGGFMKYIDISDYERLVMMITFPLEYKKMAQPYGERFFSSLKLLEK